MTYAARNNLTYHLWWHPHNFGVHQNENFSFLEEILSHYDKLNKGRDMEKYRTYLKNQVKELMTNYGKIDILWTDFSFPGEHGKDHNDWNSLELIKMIRKLQPGIIINDRLDLGEYEDGGDFATPEQYKVSEWPTRNGKRIHWETCQTFSGSWGYYRDETSWKDNKQLLVLLIESVSKGGNLLLNVGPTSRGTFDARAQERLKGMGEWMQVNGRSIYGCTEAPAEFKRPDNSLLTYNPTTKRLYVHLLDYPLQRFELPGMKGKVKYAQLLNDGSEIKMRGTDKGDLALELPVRKPDVEIPVIELVLQ